MRKINKVDKKMAQSIFSFACPCIGSCNTCMGCICGGSAEASVTAGNAAKSSISLLAQYGTQTARY